MDKHDVVDTLRSAALAHKKWTANALALIEGVPLDKAQVPVNSTECEFGKWYYSDGQNLRDLPGFKEIEEMHDGLHKTYMEIFVLLFGEVENKTSFFGRLFGRSHKVANANREAAMKKYHILENRSDTIIKQLVQLERVVMAMGDEQLHRYVLTEQPAIHIH